MDKKSIRINFNIAKNNSKVSIPRYLCKKYCFMYENDFNRTLNE